MRHKVLVKRIVSGALRRLGRTGALDAIEHWLLFWLAPRLLDTAAVPRAATPTKLRRVPVEVLCNPYLATHRAPYWLGKLHDRGLQVLLHRVLSPADIFIDVGANYGHFTFWAAALVGSAGEVHAIEPHPAFAGLLTREARRQALGNVTVHATALGCRTGHAYLNTDPHKPGRSTLQSRNGMAAQGGCAFTETSRVPVARGDDELADVAQSGLLIVKIDVEGWEPEVIHGMQVTLGHRADGVVMEISPTWIGGPTGVSRVFAQMHDLGFRAYDMTSMASRSWVARQILPSRVGLQTNVLFAKPRLLQTLR